MILRTRVIGAAVDRALVASASVLARTGRTPVLARFINSSERSKVTPIVAAVASTPAILLPLSRSVDAARGDPRTGRGRRCSNIRQPPQTVDWRHALCPGKVQEVL
jgi:hypothetical protein